MGTKLLTFWSPLSQSINTSELTHDSSVLQRNFHHVVCVHWMSSGFTGDCSFFESLQITSSTGTGYLAPWCSIRLCALQGHPCKDIFPSCLTAANSREFLVFSNPQPMPASWDKKPKCLASLEQPGNQGFTHSSPVGRDQVMISGPASSSGCEGPASSSSLTTQTDLVLDVLFCVELTAPGTGSALVQLQFEWPLLLCFPSPPPEGAVQ